MSKWYPVTEEEDIDFSDDKKFVHILYRTDRSGNCYVEIPVELLVEKLKELDIDPSYAALLSQADEEGEGVKG